MRLRDQIENVLDMELIRQQMDNQTFDYRQYGLFIIDTMSKLCAPARDVAIEELRSAIDPVSLFKYVNILLKKYTTFQTF